MPDPYNDLQKLASGLKPDMVLDVGEAAKWLGRVFPDAAINCFEPTPDTFGQLQSKVGSLKRYSLHQFALGDADGAAEFYINANEQTNSLLDNDIDNITSIRSATRPVARTTIEVRRMDRWAEEASLAPEARLVVKMDIQGHERAVIEGGREVLRRHAAALMTEVSIGRLYKGQASLKDLLGLMEDLGFYRYQLYRTRSNASGRALWLDATWLNGKLVPLEGFSASPADG